MIANVVLLLASVAVGPNTSTQPFISDPVIGTWECDGNPPPFKVIKNFNAGGTMMEIDNISPLESPTIGSWQRTSPLHYFLVARQITYNPDGTFAGIFHYTQPLVMDAGGNSMHGTFEAALVDPDGNSIPFGDGEVSCTRMPFAEHP